MAKAKIGKDVIESLTMGMYEDSRFIFREYVQNSADQIDIAVESNILNSREEGYIDIEINKNEKVISISDNATGITNIKVEEILKDIAKSTKDRTKNKGFRGIGRLGGLGYCNKLLFETSFKGEDIKSTLVWDSKKLKDIINDRNTQEDAIYVIDEVTSVKHENCDTEEHFFKVTLVGVDSELLLDKTGIIEYLSLVAPVPFDKGFIFENDIISDAKNSGFTVDTYNICVNGDQIFKPYTTTIYSGEKENKRRSSEILEIQKFQIDNLIWGWYSISDNLTIQIPAKANPARGMRLRKGNIQIGDDSTLAKFFKESRFNYYFFGEVHVFDKDLIPNSRRDYFVENNTLKKFENDMETLFSEVLSKLVRFASGIKSIGNPIRNYKSYSQEAEQKSIKGFTDKAEEKKYKEELEELKEKAKLAESNLKKEAEKIEVGSPKEKIFKHLIKDIDKKVEEITPSESMKETVFITDSLSKLDRKERKLISKVFSVVDQVLPKELADNLKEKIKENFR